MTTEILPINLSQAAGNLVSCMPYVPGKQIMVRDEVTADSKIIYTVPANYRLLLSQASVLPSNGVGMYHMIIRDSTDVTALYVFVGKFTDPECWRSAVVNYNPLLELREGFSFQLKAYTAGLRIIGHIIGYLIPTYGGY